MHVTSTLNYLFRFLPVAVMAGCSSATPALIASTGTMTAPAPPDGAITNGALSLGDAYERVCGGPGSFAIKVKDSRHFVTIPIAGPKGTQDVEFGIDTGGTTPGLMIERTHADAIGAKSEADLPKSIRLGDHDVPLPDGARWLIFDAEGGKKKGARVGRKGHQGQLGAGFLSRFLVCIDPARGRMGLADPREVRVAASAKGAIPLALQPGGENRALYPFVMIAVENGVQPVAGYGMLFDTGATTSMLEIDRIEELARKVPAWTVAKGAAGDADMIGGAFVESMIRVDKIVFTTPAEPGAAAPPAIVAASPAVFVSRPKGRWDNIFGEVALPGSAHGAVANDVLNRYRILLDYVGARLWLEPTGRAPDGSASMKRVGVAVAFDDDGCPVVQQVTDTNAMDTLSSVKLGDVLLSIDDKDACKMSHEEVSLALAGDVGNARVLKLKRGAALVDVKVTVADLFARK